MWSMVRKVVPRAIKKRIRDRGQSGHLRESTRYADIGPAGPLADRFERLKAIPGWFSFDDCAHFHLLLSYQSVIGLCGDMLEIGSYQGRSTALMAACLRADESIVVCDAFESDTEDNYANKPSPERLVGNILSINPGIHDDRIEIHECLSNDLHLDTDRRFRFIHIDGGHSAEQAYFDLVLCSRHVMSAGIIVMDDYHHANWPGVTEGTDRFLREYEEFRVLADLNRHGALGRKLYLVRE